jgi:hypothetical protein
MLGMPDDKGSWIAFGTSMAGTFAMRPALGLACSLRGTCLPSPQHLLFLSAAGVARW